MIKTDSELSREMRNRRRRGRYGERRVAKQIGGRVDGRSGKKDVRADMFSLEVKSLKHPRIETLEKYYGEARGHCPSGQIPVVVIRDTTNRIQRVYFDWHDFLALHGRVK